MQNTVLCNLPLLQSLLVSWWRLSSHAASGPTVRRSPQSGRLPCYLLTFVLTLPDLYWTLVSNSSCGNCTQSKEKERALWKGTERLLTLEKVQGHTYLAELYCPVVLNLPRVKRGSPFSAWWWYSSRVISITSCPCNVSPAKHTRTKRSFYSKALLLTSQEDPEPGKWCCLNTPLCDVSAPD